MSRVIGPADGFYRLRIRRLDLGGDVEFDWRDDVLWRSTPAAEAVEDDTWFIEAVTLDTSETVTSIAAYGSADEAREAFDSIAEDLAAMSKSEFEAEYLDPRAPEI